MASQPQVKFSSVRTTHPSGFLDKNTKVLFSDFYEGWGSQSTLK